MQGSRRETCPSSHALVAVLCVLGSSPAARATGTLALLHGQQVDTNLRDLPGRIVHGDLPWKPSWLEGVNLQWPVAPRGWRVLSWWVDVNLVRHRGLQHNLELSGAVLVRATGRTVGGALGVAAAVGFGLSHALGTPTAEDGPVEDASRRYRLQAFLPIEAVVAASALPAFEVFVRLHHRSGVYGLVAPPRVGSNFLTAGIRYRF